MWHICNTILDCETENIRHTIHSDLSLISVHSSYHILYLHREWNGIKKGSICWTDFHILFNMCLKAKYCACRRHSKLFFALSGVVWKPQLLQNNWTVVVFYLDFHRFRGGDYYYVFADFSSHGKHLILFLRYSWSHLSPRSSILGSVWDCHGREESVKFGPTPLTEI